jgi:hypothetical protein
LHQLPGIAQNRGRCYHFCKISVEKNVCHFFLNSKHASLCKNVKEKNIFEQSLKQFSLSTKHNS